VRWRSPDASCRCRSNQRHAAGCLAREERIRYPFHPRSGELVVVVGVKRHAGIEHFVIRQPDRTLALLPAWMATPSMSEIELVEHPRFCLERLVDLRYLVDALLASCRGESSLRQGAGHERRTTPSAGSVRTTRDDDTIAGVATSEACAVAAGVAGRGSRDRTRQVRQQGDQ
jgi:hypothetical protein